MGFGLSIVVGLVLATAFTAPLAFLKRDWALDFLTVQLGGIAAVYSGFALVDARLAPAAAEVTVTLVFLVLALAGRWFSPAILILWVQVGFRATCYYARGAYYKAFFGDPPACAVGEPGFHRKYGMENRFPFVLMNLHRVFLYLALIPLTVMWVDLGHAFWYEGGPRLGIGVLLLASDALLTSLYVFSCHSFRHLAGGGLDCYSCTAYTRRRQSIWERVSTLNRRHGLWFWASLASIVMADIYIRLLAMDVIDTSTPIIGGFL